MVTRTLTLLYAASLTACLLQAPADAATQNTEVKTTAVAVQTVKKDASADHLKKEDRQTIEAVNEIDGVNVDPEKFEEKKKKKKGIGFPNPVGWLLKPVTDMQKRVIHLEQQIMRLEGPIAGLQKPMLGLRGKMVEVQGNIGTLNNGMGKLDTNMGKLQTNMNNIAGKMETVDGRLARMEKELHRMYEPIAGLQEPVRQLQKPVAGVSDQLGVLKNDLNELKTVVNTTSTLILIAIVAIGLLVSVGTPIIAVFAWRHRNQIIRKFEGPAAAANEQAKEDQRVPVGSSR
ncbi:MAG: hypothetical protein SGJ27_12075 [Candidatus Melainabacteria bacterium]|nr:hypothetical protein [Candidatus Melainabacteria bacterium]